MKKYHKIRLMLDEIDQKILSALRGDGRIANIKLAQELGISAITVAKRIDRMVRDNIFVIRGVPNPFKMGFDAHAFIGLDVDLKKLNSACAKLVESQNVSTILTTFGRLDILLIVDFYNAETLLDFVKEHIFSLEGVKGIEISFVSEIKKRSYQMFGDAIAANNEPVQLDETDHKLIHELEKNGRSTCYDLAKKLNTSSATVSRRVSSLLRNNIIKIVALPNPAKLGFHANSFITVQADSAKVNDICTKLSVYSELHTIMTLVNNYQIVIGGHFPNSKMLYDFLLEKIVQLDGVLNLETFIRAELKKSFYIPEFTFYDAEH